MDQRPYPGPSRLFHFRMSTLFVILWLTDFIMFLIAVENTISNGVGGMVLFASEVSNTGVISLHRVLHVCILVRNLDGQRFEHHFKIPSLGIRVKARWSTRW